MSSSTSDPPSTLRAAILIVSDTASKDPSSDKTVPLLRSTLEEDGAGRWDVENVKVEIVPDDVVEIQRTVKNWCDVEEDRPNLVLTSGGTGFATKDWTPEVGNSSGSQRS